MQCYTELTPPTAVTHSVSLPFLSASANNLIVAKNSLVQIFSLKSVITEVDHDSRRSFPNGDNPHGQAAKGNNVDLLAHPDQKLQRGERLHTTKLVLVSQYELSGTITSLARVKTLRSKSGGEALLVALKDAKLSLVEWDPERYSISTSSLHYYEREDLQGSPWGPELGQSSSILTVDPSSRCAALKFGTRNIAILPFHQAGDDLVMDDYDPELDGDPPEPTTTPSKMTNGGSLATQTPYSASFVLSLLALDPSLTHPVHLTFLHEYREPTIGVLSSQVASSVGLLHERRDLLAYTVFTLDLEQRASTTLLSVNKLPFDLHTVMPLALPVGGALLIGTNQVIHVDQAGKTNGVAVNEFAKQCSSFTLIDQSELGLRLEGCVTEQIGAHNGDVLIVSNTGELALLNFKIDGRSVSGLSMRRIYLQSGESVVLAGPSCISTIGRGRMFIGSENSDSIVLGWSRKSHKAKRQRSNATTEIDGEESVSDEEVDGLEDDDDDLYSGAKVIDEAAQRQPSSLSTSTTSDDYLFRVHDVLMSLAPLRDITFGRSISAVAEDTQSSRRNEPELELLVTSGCGKAGALSILNREINPALKRNYDISCAQGIWSVCVKAQSAEGVLAGSDNLAAHQEHDKFMIISKLNDAGDEQSIAYSLTSGALEEVKESDFDPSAGATVDVGTLNGGTRIVQVLKNEIRAYDANFGLAQIFPLSDDDSEIGPKVVSASFSEPYILLIKDDSSLMLIKGDDSGDLEEVERQESLLTTKCISGSLYEDSNDVFRLESNEELDDEGGNVLMFLLTLEAGLRIFRLSDLATPIYTADGLGFLPPFLSTEFTVRRSAAKEILTEILVTELGDATTKSPYLILRSINDDLTIYQAYQSPVEGTPDTALRFLKLSNPYLPKMTGEDPPDNNQKRGQPLRALADINGFSAVFVPGASPCFVIKPASCLPQVVSLRSKGVKALSSLHRPDLEHGFTYVDNQGNLHGAQLPSHLDYSTGWVMRRIYSGEEIQALDYHARSNRYILGTSHKVDFKLPEDELHYDWSTENTSFLPQVERGCIKLLEPTTWTIVDAFELEPAEVVTSIKTMNLEVSEHTHVRRSLIAVGTALLRGEDLAAHGRIYIFDIIEVVPEPDRPETGRKFKLIAKEEVRGAVTALCEIGTEGFLLAAQGQKCMVRGLKEDGTLLPVAFMDMQCYVSVAKELEGTGLCIMGDAIKGLWFTGYSEDPYQLRLFSKTSQHIEVMAAEFLPHDKQLYILVADADSHIHVLQFDPEHPKSLTGQRLLHLSTFHTGTFPSRLTLLRRHPTPYELLSSPPPTNPNPAHDPSSSSTIQQPQTQPQQQQQQQQQQQDQPPSPPTHHLLLTSPTGSLSLLTPLSPPTYRTLSALQSYLTSTLPHHLGLNPRSHRNVEADLSVGGRGIVDGGILKRWMELGSWKRGEGVGRVVGEGEGGEGEGEWVVRGLLEGVGVGGRGGGLGFV